MAMALTTRLGWLGIPNRHQRLGSEPDHPPPEISEGNSLLFVCHVDVLFVYANISFIMHYMIDSKNAVRLLFVFYHNSYIRTSLLVVVVVVVVPSWFRNGPATAFGFGVS